MHYSTTLHYSIHCIFSSFSVHFQFCNELLTKLNIYLFYFQLAFNSTGKSRIRKTKHLSANAESRTNTAVGWTKKSQKPNFFEKRNKSSLNIKNQKMSRDMPKLAITLRPEVSHPSGSVVFNLFCTAKSAKKKLFLRGHFRPLPNKNVQMLNKKPRAGLYL